MNIILCIFIFTMYDIGFINGKGLLGQKINKIHEDELQNSPIMYEKFILERENDIPKINTEIVDSSDKKIGQGIIVPHAFYKIVINNQTKEVAGWQFPHTKPYQNLGNDLTKFRMPISQIQIVAGVNFQYPQGARELQPGQEWPVDFGALTNAKRAKCGANASAD